MTLWHREQPHTTGTNKQSLLIKVTFRESTILYWFVLSKEGREVPTGKFWDGPRAADESTIAALA